MWNQPIFGPCVQGFTTYQGGMKRMVGLVFWDKFSRVAIINTFAFNENTVMNSKKRHTFVLLE